MPRKPEPPWPVIKKTLELAVLHGKGNLAAIRRSLDIELRKLRKEEGIATGYSPDERTIRWIVNDYINELPREAVREHLPPSVWTLREDYEEFRTEPQEAAIGKALYEETPHKQKMRELSLEFAREIKLPSEFSNFIEERESGDWFIGKRCLINIDETGKVTIPLVFEGHLYEGLFSHIRTSSFSDVLGQIRNWQRQASEVLVESHELLKTIRADVERRYGVSLTTDGPTLAGLTPEYSETICLSAITGRIRIDASHYKLKDDALICIDTFLYRPKDNGRIVICKHLPRYDLESLRDTHIEMIKEYFEHDLGKRVHRQLIELLKIERYIREQLEKFADMERLPGYCHLCAK